MCTTYIRYTHTSHNNSNPFTASHDKQHVSIRRDEYSREKCDHLLFKRQQHDTHNTQIKYIKIPEIFYLLGCCYISTLIFFFCPPIYKSKATKYRLIDSTIVCCFVLIFFSFTCNGILLVRISCYFEIYTLYLERNEEKQSVDCKFS